MQLSIFPENVKAYADHLDRWGTCTRCAIGEHANYHVFARGQLPCDVLFIGEAPGVTEDREGWPFIGEAGKLLDEWIEEAQDFAIQAQEEWFEQMPGGPQGAHGRPLDVATINTVCCRPFDANGKNRPPTFAEQCNCIDRVQEFLEAFFPRKRAFVFLGRVAEFYDDTTIIHLQVKLKLRHPAYILRKGGAGSPEDILARKSLNEFFAKIG